MKDSNLAKGYILRGKDYTYRIEGILGQGSFGITYLATTKIKAVGSLGSFDTEIKVAVKEFFMHEFCSRHADGTVTEMSEGSLVSGYARKFRKEAENLARLSHPGIVRVLEVFEANNTCYYSMEYMDGGSLDAYVRQCSGLPEQEATECIRQIADALGYMHKHKMLHLDLKPLNVMRSADGSRLTLIDFGLSKQYDSNGEPESSTTIGLGTPGYAPIEQAEHKDDSKDFRPTLDIYALGATLYKLLTGNTPPKATEVNSAVLDGDDIIMSGLQSAGVSAAVSDVVSKAMHPSPKKRIQSVVEFISLLPSDMDECTQPVTPKPAPKPAPHPQPTPQQTPHPKPAPTPAPKPKGLPKWLLGVLAGLAAIVAIALFAGRCGSESVSFATGINNGHEYVDLGLSVKWATCNVGASSPEGYGSYFAWGETSPKSEYSWTTLKYCNNTTGDSFSKYNQTEGGTGDNRTVLELSDDAACANWGGSWRMPTDAEFQELIDKCTWTWTKVNGKKGYKVVSKSNGNSIFLPAAGYRVGTSLSFAGSDGSYWSSSLYESGSLFARYLNFGSDSHGASISSRFSGHSVRPVFR